MLLLATMFVSPRRVLRPALMVDRTDGDRAFADVCLGRAGRTPNWTHGSGRPSGDSHAPARGWWIAAVPGGRSRMPSGVRDGLIARMSPKSTPAAARVGDWLEARGIHGEPARRGQIVEILGEPGHEHYKVHWDERHESIVYPADGVQIIHKKSH